MIQCLELLPLSQSFWCCLLYLTSVILHSKIHQKSVGLSMPQLPTAELVSFERDRSNQPQSIYIGSFRLLTSRQSGLMGCLKHSVRFLLRLCLGVSGRGLQILSEVRNAVIDEECWDRSPNSSDSLFLAYQGCAGS